MMPPLRQHTAEPWSAASLARPWWARRQRYARPSFANALYRADWADVFDRYRLLQPSGSL